MFKKQQSRHPDPFAHLLGDNDTQGDKQSKYLRRAVSRSDDEDVGEDQEYDGEEYVSPFRDERAVYQAQRRRLARYPTTSATSAYTTAKPQELGYRNIKASTKRAKDIQFPLYLQNNERRQQQLLQDLEAKEAHLRYLRDSQVIIDHTGEAEESTEESVEDSQEDADEEPEQEEVGEENEVEGEEADEEPEQEVDGDEAPVEEAGEEIQAEETPVVETEVEQIQTAEDLPVEEAPVEETQTEEAPAHEASVQEAQAGETVADEGPAEVVKKVTVDEEPSEIPEEEASGEEAESTSIEASKEIKDESDLADPAKVPMVPFSKEHERSFFSKIFNTAPPVLPNPVATPEDPEEIVKIPDFGYLNKAIYDRIKFQDRKHKEWISDYNSQEKQKYDSKRTEYNSKLDNLRSEIKEIKSTMEQLKKDTDAKIDVSENELTRKFFEMTQIHIKDKNQIFKETELIKSQKISEKDSVVDKQGEVQKEIDELNTQKSSVQDEYILWSNNLADLSAHIDAKVANLASISLRQQDTQSEIARLEKKKKDLLEEIDNNNAKHVNNTTIIEGANNKTYLPKINEIDNSISNLLTQLTVIKQESANERTQLSAITKKIELERIAHEEKLKLEAEERKRKEEDLLGKQRQELEAKAQEAKLKHEEELEKLKKDYDQLEAKFKEQQQQKKDAIAFANDRKEVSRDSSLYEYGTEEEIMSA